jgi:serine protease Do
MNTKPLALLAATCFNLLPYLTSETIPLLPQAPAAATTAEEAKRIRVYEKASPAVVTIDLGLGHGSGFIISPDGLVLTNAHVAEDSGGSVTMILANGQEVMADVVGYAQGDLDIAALKIRNAKNLPFLRFAAPNSVKVGQSVYAIGTPLDTRFHNTFTYGVVSRIHPQEGLIQHDAATNGGNSGGPLLNSDGQVIGINSGIYSETESYSGISIALAIEKAQPLLLAVKNGTAPLVSQRPRPDDEKILSLPPEGKTVTATLKPGDRTLPNNSYYHVYVFRGKAGEKKTLEMSSDQLDGSLILVSRNLEKVIAQNDDISPDNFNARLEITLPEDGMYFLIVATFAGGESGSYQLKHYGQ